MASVAPREQAKRSRQRPVLGPFLGFVIVYAVLRVLLYAAVGFGFLSKINDINPFVFFFIALLVGGSLGGLIQLWKQGKTAEIPGFLRHMLVVSLKFLLMWVPMFLAAWLGERSYGSVGHDIGLVAGAVVIIPVLWWLAVRSAREQAPAPPPA